ncbi:MAG: DUF115 domain-containing protein [Candidatus Altiarchaeota archaeon]|nr:DUF115 domain-containing protein [Candidatus Altiarchaeota archaeon]
MYYTHKYLEVVRALDIDPTGDRDATRHLSTLLKDEEYAHLEKLIHKRPVMIYGCGPSLEIDLQKITDAGMQKKFINVAVDGAVYMLLRYRILPHLNVTDLDGDIDSILLANKHGTMTVVHAHAGNLKEIVRNIPRFEGRVFGATRAQEMHNVKNFGGFTDGDMSLHIVDHYKPKLIVFAGMDYGRVIGVHSGKYNSIRKPRSMKVSKEILEEHMGKSRTKVYNITSGGEHIKHTTHVDVPMLAHIIGI